MLSGPLARAPELEIERCYSVDRDSESSRGPHQLMAVPGPDNQENSDQSASKITPASFEAMNTDFAAN